MTELYHGLHFSGRISVGCGTVSPMRGIGHFPGYSLHTRLEALETQVGDSGIQFLAGEDDPSAGAGVAATQPALYARTTGGVSTWYFKEGAADTAWIRVVSQVFDALLTPTRLKVSAPGSAVAPAIALPGDEGLYQEATNQIGFAVSGARYVRLQATLLSVLNGSFSSAQNITIGNYLISASSQATALSELTPFKTHDLALSAVAILRVTTSDANQILTSITSGVNGRDLVVMNANPIAGDPVTLQHDNGSDGTAANRLLHAGGLDNVIQAGGASVYRYSSDSRWRLLLP